jgi:beta-glucosidase
MAGRRRTAAIGATIAVVVAVVAGAVAASTRSSDERALQPTRAAASQSIERKVDGLIRRMTLEEKLQQLQLLSDGQVTDEDARAGVGAVFSLVDPARSTRSASA